MDALHHQPPLEFLLNYPPGHTQSISSLSGRLGTEFGRSRARSDDLGRRSNCSMSGRIEPRFNDVDPKLAEVGQSWPSCWVSLGVALYMLPPWGSSMAGPKLDRSRAIFRIDGTDFGRGTDLCKVPTRSAGVGWDLPNRLFCQRRRQKNGISPKPEQWVSIFMGAELSLIELWHGHG